MTPHRPLASASVIFLARFAGAALAFLNLLLLARGLSPRDVGIVVSAQALALLAASIGTGNLEGLAIRLFPQHTTNPDAVAGFARASLRVAMRWVPVAAVATAGFIIASTPMQTGDVLAVSGIAVTVLAAAASRTGSQWAMGLGAPTVAALAQMFCRPLMYTVYLGILLASGTLSVATAIWAGGAAYVLPAIWPWFLSLRRLPASAWTPVAETPPTWRREGWILLLTLVFLDRFPEVVTAVAGLVLPEDDVATLSIALRIVLLLRMATMSIGMAMGPALSRAWGGGKDAALPVADRVTLASVGIALPLGLAVVLAAAPVTSLFGPAYLGAAILVAILSVGTVGQTVFGPTLLTLTALGARQAILHWTAAGIVGLVAGIVIGAALYGSVGAAVGIVIALLGWSAGLGRAVVQQTGSAIGLGPALLRRWRKRTGTRTEVM